MRRGDRRRRSTLGWQTPAEVWSARKPIEIDRLALREEVLARTARLREKLRDPTRKGA